MDREAVPWDVTFHRNGFGIGGAVARVRSGGEGIWLWLWLWLWLAPGKNDHRIDDNPLNLLDELP